jgi:hypothetical protein
MRPNKNLVWPFESAVREVVALLARRRYAALEKLSGGVRLSAAHLRTAVREYGRTIVVPPPNATPPLDVVEILPGRATRRSWAVNVDLWTAEGGRSDLTLEMTVREGKDGDYVIELDNLHVM